MAPIGFSRSMHDFEKIVYKVQPIGLKLLELIGSKHEKVRAAPKAMSLFFVASLSLQLLALEIQRLEDPSGSKRLPFRARKLESFVS